MSLFKKFGTSITYAEWPNVIDALTTCNGSSAIAKYGGRDEACWNKLNCALQAADASQQAQYSSAATILGLLPTVLSMLATSSDELLRIHSRFPLLAFLLALCNPSTITTSLTSPPTVTPLYHTLHTRRSTSFTRAIKDGYTFPWGLRVRLSKVVVHDLLLHFVVGAMAATILWQAIYLGAGGVIVFACWTWHEPLTWVGVGGLVHLLGVLSFRLCLSRVDVSADSPFLKWRMQLSETSNLQVAHPKIARFMALLFQVIGLMNYGFGTVMLSGTTLVSPRNALLIFVLIGLAALASRLVTIWLLEVYPEEVEVLVRGCALCKEAESSFVAGRGDDKGGAYAGLEMEPLR